MNKREKELLLLPKFKKLLTVVRFKKFKMKVFLLLLKVLLWMLLALNNPKVVMLNILKNPRMKKLFKRVLLLILNLKRRNQLNKLKFLRQKLTLCPIMMVMIAMMMKQGIRSNQLLLNLHLKGKLNKLLRKKLLNKKLFMKTAVNPLNHVILQLNPLLLPLISNQTRRTLKLMKKFLQAILSLNPSLLKNSSLIFKINPLPCQLTSMKLKILS